MSTSLRYRAGELVEVRRVQRVDTNAYWRKVDADASYLEARHWVPAFDSLFRVMGSRFAGRLVGSGRRWSRGRRDAQTLAAVAEIMRQVFDRSQVRQDVAATGFDLYGLVFNVALAGTGAQFGVAFDLGPSDLVKAMIRKRANRLAGPVADTIYQAIKRQMVAGVEAGDSIPHLADRIRNYMVMTSKFRATRIARTEVISAYNGAVRDGGDQHDGVAGYEWIATVDGRVRPAHLEANGQQIARDGRFLVGGDQMRHPGDPEASTANIVNCRCAMIPLVDAPRRAARVSLSLMNNTLLRWQQDRLTGYDALQEIRATAHYPAGSPKGGQFQPGKGTSGGAGTHEEFMGRLRDEHPKAQLEINQHRDGHISIDKIVVDPGARNTGEGTKIMHKVLARADAQGRIVSLTPSSDFGGSLPKLKTWYTGMGFVLNKGKNAIYEISDSMIRLPKGSHGNRATAHYPAGSPKGGQFMPGKGTGGGTPHYELKEGVGRNAGFEWTTTINGQKVKIADNSGTLSADAKDRIMHGLDMATKAKTIPGTVKIVVVNTPNVNGFTQPGSPNTIYLSKVRAEATHREYKPGFHPPSSDHLAPATATVLHEYGHLQDYHHSKAQGKEWQLRAPGKSAHTVSEYATQNGAEETAEAFSAWATGTRSPVVSFQAKYFGWKE